MKTQSLSRRNTPLSLIGSLLLVIITLLGCRGFVNRVIESDTVLLTLDDLHKMGLRKSGRTSRNLNDLSSIKKLPVIAGFEQGWSGGDLNIQYWLFHSSSTAKKAAEAEWTWLFAAVPNFHPELNPEDVIGDATWRNIHRSWEECERGPTDIYFVKHNLFVSVRTNGPPSNRLQDARDIARHIETQIAAVLKEK
ncbi:MAG: hypothetical protein OXH00_07715 [Candidatus Poribacteria bacterium]|nr:hypothetical protein [Candidatus Poribacteria bacterium]